jgi:hypothetical protein
MAEELVAVRMKHTIDQFPLVMELLMDQVYRLPKFYADRLMESQACERIDATSASTPRLEAAALAAARRRG